VEYGFYAAPSYLDRHGVPEHPADLSAAGFIGFTGSPAEVARGAETCSLPSGPRYVANTNMAVRDMAVAGLGVALLPCFQAAPFLTARQLAPMLTGWSRPPVTVHAVLASRKLLSPTIRAFIDTARDEFLN
jgi:DNA-binding transcriptional LysR family regulator